MFAIVCPQQHLEPRNRKHRHPRHAPRVHHQDIANAIQSWGHLGPYSIKLSCRAAMRTMKIASSDEELAFKQKEKELASYTRKVALSRLVLRRELPYIIP